MATRRKVSNLLALAVLAILMTGRSMHPYEIASLLRRTGKERDMRIKWGSFYTVVQNLEKYGFIEAVGSDRAGRRPERTRYTITDAGRAELRDWLHELIAEPAEIPHFEAALSVAGVLSPDEVSQLLRTRLAALEREIAEQRAALAEVDASVPRVFLIESEFAVAMREAETAWVRGLLAEFDEGTFPGLDQWRDYHRIGRMAPELTDLLYEGGPSTD